MRKDRAGTRGPRPGTRGLHAWLGGSVAPGRQSLQHPANADVFINIRPVDAGSVADDFVLRALGRSRIQKPPRPREWHADLPPIHQMRADHIVAHIHTTNLRLALIHAAAACCSARPISRGLAPRANSPFSRRSTETDLSPASIFATRDWLDLRRCASCCCVNRRAARFRRRAWLSASFVSTRAASSVLRPRKSAADPTRQPRASNRARFVFFMCSQRTLGESTGLNLCQS